MRAAQTFEPWPLAIRLIMSANTNTKPKILGVFSRLPHPEHVVRESVGQIQEQTHNVKTVNAEHPDGMRKINRMELLALTVEIQVLAQVVSVNL